VINIPQGAVNGIINNLKADGFLMQGGCDLRKITGSL
jgi:hypothetical protein